MPVTISDSSLVRLLLTSQFSIKFGFTLLMPYLAGHLTHGLGLTASAVGLILGIRNASQRGLALVGDGQMTVKRSRGQLPESWELASEMVLRGGATRT
ncbi:hypothetical protein Misp03_59660 [Microbispora sp. NBRC 16548]|nr:hypothetical protein Misp03_59660 [Microbispora sp. NBRC 16548]